MSEKEKPTMESLDRNDQVKEMTNSGGKSWRPTPDTIAKRLGETVVLLNLQNDCFFELNSTASRLWELTTSGLDRQEVMEQMLSEFDVDQANFVIEYNELLESMQKRGLVEIDD
jgi:hypothetical protein